MKPLIILLLFLSAFSLKAQKASNTQYGAWLRFSNGINQFSDIYRNDGKLSNHYRTSYTAGIHYSKVVSDKLHLTGSLGYSFYKKYTLKGVKYDEQSFPLEINAAYELFRIKKFYSIDMNVLGGVQRFVQYRQPINQLSNTKHTSLNAGYGIGIGFNHHFESWDPHFKYHKCYASYVVYGKQRFYTFTVITYINRGK